MEWENERKSNMHTSKLDKFIGLDTVFKPYLNKLIATATCINI